jgi:hypothetical protein
MGFFAKKINLRTVLQISANLNHLLNVSVWRKKFGGT